MTAIEKGLSKPFILTDNQYFAGCYSSREEAEAILAQYQGLNPNKQYIIYSSLDTKPPRRTSVITYPTEDGIDQVAVDLNAGTMTVTPIENSNS